METTDPLAHVERRWPVLLAIVLVLLLLAALPARIRAFPVWSAYAVGCIEIVPIAVVWLMPGSRRWLYIERLVTLFFSAATVLGNTVNLAMIVGAMLRRTAEVGGLELLTSSVGVWVTNVLGFALFYWQLDRGGPDPRSRGQRLMADWVFAQEGVPPEHLPPDWRPVFVDYLYLAFNTATAFSPTDTLPLTPRAKMLMLLQSMLSLTTIVVVASRAINILGS